MSLTYKMERVTLRWFWNLKDQIGTLNSSRTKYRRKKKFRWMKYPPILLTKGKKYSANLRLRIKICMLSHHYIHIPRLENITWCSGWLWYPAFRHWAIVAPWKITIVKYESKSRILSAAMAATSRRAGSGPEWNEKDINDGWIITTELATFSRFSIILKYAVSSGLLLKTCNKQNWQDHSYNYFRTII